MTTDTSLDFSRPWTYAECAHFLRIAESTLRDRVKRGKGAPPRIKSSETRQGQVLFWPPSVVAWLTGQEIGRPTRRPGRPRKARVGAV